MQLMLLLPSQLPVIFFFPRTILCCVELFLVVLASPHGEAKDRGSHDPRLPCTVMPSLPEICLPCMFTGPWIVDLMNKMDILRFRCLFPSLYAGRSHSDLLP